MGDAILGLLAKQTAEAKQPFPKVDRRAQRLRPPDGVEWHQQTTGGTGRTHGRPNLQRVRSVEFSLQRHCLLGPDCGGEITIPQYVLVNRRSGKYSESSKIASRATIQNYAEHADHREHSLRRPACGSDCPASRPPGCERRSGGVHSRQIAARFHSRTRDPAKVHGQVKDLRLRWIAKHVPAYFESPMIDSVQRGHRQARTH
jgi:hypothetical protein